MGAAKLLSLYLVQNKPLLDYWKMKSQFIVVSVAVLVITSFITEGDCFTGTVPGKVKYF